MNHKTYNRRHFLKLSGVGGVGLSAGKKLVHLPELYASRSNSSMAMQGPDIPFIPNRVASWWNALEDLQWNQKAIRDKVKRRAAGFAKAKIDTAVNYGFHIRFDFSNYFGQLHEYFRAVRDELHQYNIKFIEHYSCNHVERPRGTEEFNKLHRNQRHHILLFHDPVAARHAQYEGHFFQDICELDIFDGTRGYARQYQMEAFCHNNPGFLDMHAKYLERIIREVDFDGYEIDDMCDYVGLRSCGCKYCRERFRRDYGHEIPEVSNKAFWGDTTKPMLNWGNYENPVFRDWIKMKDDIIADHVAMVKRIIGNKPLLTCCSSTGPITLNAISLNLERIAGRLDFFMLENVGTNIKSVNWIEKDAEALQQKDIARQRGQAPAIALSYTIYKDGGYFGWSLARFWGVANWASTFHQRLQEDPPDAMELEDMIHDVNNWEVAHSNLDNYTAKDFYEVRLVYNYYCRINGWRQADGTEHWDKVKKWSAQLVENNVGYRFVRYQELADAAALLAERQPLILDSVACLSDHQYKAIEDYLKKGGIAWLALPFGTHDESGKLRSRPLSDQLLQNKYRHLHLFDSSAHTNTLEQFIAAGTFRPAIRQVAGDKGWALRVRFYKDQPVLHFLNTRLNAIPDASIKDISGLPIVRSIESTIKNNRLRFEIDRQKLPLRPLQLVSPELEATARPVPVTGQSSVQTLEADLSGIRIYAAAHTSA
ncbi:hypothetical protein [Niabella soli]|uniref:Uncharacterized protein n=1 Tax=Niabella soli DSM 19437 TaxID=929713 RepID=W0EUM1_9BACT|nr:hypothetical protein [Niabella soli]AHF14482.1 hypothetical protein NIASO_03345 [Niabella soli DSM 19437]